MKWTIALLMLCSLGTAAQPQWQPAQRTQLPQFTPAASKCDLSACQQNCYVQQSQCKNNGDAGCGSLGQMCVQNCSSQCR
ncbi:hypothetical protein [Candidatus Pantoea soli]|uniref:Uncharacterized protein n=1 Tax=Candidatus Pantoea soli TaxID=3098669 RepID=A0A518XCJ1_9GAMM|nr:hypothetical protein [Pantoea soli]QDY41944.1 hypothetical protein D8B20_08595 [Pantoea soli]